MTGLPLHTKATAPAAAQPILDHVTEKYGFIPNLLAGLANAPATLEAYTTLAGLMEQTSFDAVERQVIVLTAVVTRPCMKRRCPIVSHRCMVEIDVERILESARRLLAVA